jgi:copper(I)-binding protein
MASSASPAEMVSFSVLGHDHGSSTPAALTLSSRQTTEKPDVRLVGGGSGKQQHPRTGAPSTTRRTFDRTSSGSVPAQVPRSGYRFLVDMLTSRERAGPRTGGSISRRFGAAFVAALATITLPITACGPATQDTPPVTSSAVGRIGEITVADVEFLFTPPISGDDVYPAGATAPLSVTIVNDGQKPDRLVQVSSPIAENGLLVGGGLTIPPGQTVTAGQSGAAGVEVADENGDNMIALAGLREPIRSGRTYPVTFEFECAGDLLLEVPVDTPDVPRR